MAIHIHTNRFSIATDLLSAGQFYVQSFSTELPGNEKNNIDQLKWPDDFDA